MDSRFHSFWLIGACSEQGANVRSCFVGAKDLADESAPKFDQYRSKASPPRTPAKLDLRSNPIARMYRTAIRQEMRQGANFAGLYRVAIWGCGSSCSQFAVVNLKTGSVITAQGVENVSHVDFAADDFLPKANSGTVGFRFRKDKSIAGDRWCNQLRTDSKERSVLLRPERREANMVSQNHRRSEYMLAKSCRKVLPTNKFRTAVGR